jgi:putative transposase
VAASREFALSCGKQQLGEAFTVRWQHLSRAERNEVRTRFHAQGIDLTWLLVPRTVLDQVVRDLEKTIKTAKLDRTEKRQRPAGFPGFKKWSYANSIRLQVEASKNTNYQAGWSAGQLVLPGLGRLKLQEHGYALPATPACLVTMARNAAGQWHVTFAAKPGQGLSARARRLRDSQNQAIWEDLPKDAVGNPTIEGLDMSLPDFAVSSGHGKLGRVRHLKRYASRLRTAGKSVSRRKKGSGRWKKAVRKMGKLHVRVANVRQAGLRLHAQTIAARSAIVCIEDLSLPFMLKNPKLAKSAYDLAWGSFIMELQHECAKRGHLLLKANPFAPTTQTCPACGVVNTALRNNLSIRTWECPGCGESHDRDFAASCNVQDMALAAFLESSAVAESVTGMSQLHPELEAFIARGGMTALAQVNAWVGSRQGCGLPLGCAVPVKRVSSPRSVLPGLESGKMG